MNIMKHFGRNPTSMNKRGQQAMGIQKYIPASLMNF
jgi:hypothetical protein